MNLEYAVSRPTSPAEYRDAGGLDSLERAARKQIALRAKIEAMKPGAYGRADLERAYRTTQKMLGDSFDAIRPLLRTSGKRGADLAGLLMNASSSLGGSRTAASRATSTGPKPVASSPVAKTRNQVAADASARRLQRLQRAEADIRLDAEVDRLRSKREALRDSTPRASIWDHMRNF